jgi:hypothetical protein
LPLNLDSCIAGVFIPGNIGASSGLPPVAPIVPSFVGPPPSTEETASPTDTVDWFDGQLLHEAATATATVDAIFAGTVGIVETATATDTVAVQTSTAHTTSISEAGEALDRFYVHQPATYTDSINEVAAATDTPAAPNIHSVSISEMAAATDAPDAEIEPVVRDAVVPGPVMINSDGISRQANANGVMINL